jgi:hypothetical protein
MVTKTLAAALALVMLSGCVHKQAFLTKPATVAGGESQIVRCEAKGFGLVPMILEEVSYDDCMQFYRQHGFLDSDVSGYVK